MHNLTVTNVNQALSAGLNFLQVAGVAEESRNGKVLVAPAPVTTTYLNPTERVLFSPLRDANPWFHLMESLWMLAGMNDVAFPAYFNSRYNQYSDDGVTIWGAYGHRWLRYFGYDQLSIIARELRANPESRRAVLAMWDARGCGLNHSPDILKALDGGKDVPCNTHAYFDCRNGKLNMTVCCRSNDILWGAYGANAVHFSILLEVMAAWVGIPVGEYRQMSNNYHLYTGVVPEDRITSLAVDAESHDYYSTKSVRPYQMVQYTAEAFLQGARSFCHHPEVPKIFFTEPFFHDVAVPMYNAWRVRKEKLGSGLNLVELIRAEDWRLACYEWIVRRETMQKGVKNAN